jgi:hypothetical protein
MLNTHYVATVFSAYLTTVWSRVYLDVLRDVQLVKELPAFYRTPRFITLSKSTGVAGGWGAGFGASGAAAPGSRVHAVANWEAK